MDGWRLTLPVRVIPVPCLEDNYAYLVVGARGTVVVVDPSEAAPVLEALAREGLVLSAIWLTHHHLDHVGGVAELVRDTGVRDVIGSRHDHAAGRIPKQTRAVTGEDVLELDGEPVRILSVPGHTLGAITFVVGDDAFTGDTLFVAGCGRVFEGTMAMMAESMRVLRALAPTTRIWCGHEYTVSNLAFACHVEPPNEDAARALVEAKARRANGEPTVPGLIGDERRVNPFLRFDLEDVFHEPDAVLSFTRLREAKNVFRA